MNNDLLTRTGNFQSLNTKDYIGFSFKTNLYPIEDTRNIGIRVIDISAFSKAYPAYFLAWKNLTSDSKSFSFTSFNKFLDESKISKTIYHGFDLDLLGLSIGHKHTYTTTFGENRVNDNKSVFGEMHIIVRDSCYRMSYSSVINKIILKSYLDKSYEKELHSIHPYEFFNNYGGFVARDYSSGGRVIALYSALSKSNDDDENKESNLDKEIDASVSWDNSSINNNLKFGRGGNGTVSITKSFSSVKMCLKTIGGSTSGGFSIPQEINNSSIDLSGWLSSLEVKENHVIAEFNENGLIPISDFIFEHNLKNLFNDYIANKNIPVNTNIIEPYILIGQVSLDWSAYSINEALIITRYGLCPSIT